jgi:hypothetical protein
MYKTFSKYRTKGFKLIILGLAVILINILSATFWSSMAVAQLTGITPTTVPSGGCAIDGDLLARTPVFSPFSSFNGDFLENPSAPGTGGGVFTNPGGLPIDPMTAFHVIDGYGNADQNIFTQGSKFNDNPNDWHWTTGAPTGKDDINHALFHFATDPEGHTWLMGGSDRSTVVGTSYIDFELLQNTLVRNPDGTFTSSGPDGGRTAGDIVVTIEFSNGGGNAQITAYRWTQTSPGVFTYVVFAPPAGTTFAASNINGTVDVPFGAFGSTTYDQYAYAEVAFDINELVPGLNTCIGAKTVLIKTKASDVINAALKDFVEPVQLELGSIPTVHVNSSTICTGQSATLTATVTFGVGPFTYVWSPGGQTTSSITVSPTSTTAYSVQVTGLSGCYSHPDTGIVTVNPAPSCLINGAIGPVCPLSSNIYTAPANMSTYAWSVSGAADIFGASDLQTVTVKARSDCNSSYTLVLDISDGNGCSSSCDKTVLVRDVTPPVLTGTLLTGQTLINDCMANAPVGPTEASIAALYTDACSGDITVVKSGTPTGTDCGWTVTYHFTIADKCGNFATPFEITYSGGDKSAPYLTGILPTGQTLINDCMANAPVGPTEVSIAALYTDACGGDITVVKSGTPTGTDCDWTVTYHYTIVDKCGNFTTPFDITYSGGDKTAPVLSGVPGNISKNCTTPLPPPANVSATDNCGAVTVTMTSVTSDSTCPANFIVTRTWTATDACGNSSSAYQIITTGNPGVNAPLAVENPILYLMNLPPRIINVTCGTQPDIIPPTAVDRCLGGIPVLDCWRSDNATCGSVFTLPSTNVYYQAHDACGNISAIDTVTVNLNTALPCIIADPVYIPFNYMIGNTLSIDPSIILTNIASMSWTVTGPGGWLITAGTSGPTVTYTAGIGTGHFTLTLVDIFGCTTSCTTDITVQIADEYCTVTQGYWGNSGGNFCNTGNKLNYINSLLGTTGLLVGCASNTLYFAPGEGQCIINLLPGGGTPARITGTNTCGSHPGIQIKNGKINNVLLAQTITLGLNLRIKTNLGLLSLDTPVLEVANSTGCLGGPGTDSPVGGTIVNYNFPMSVYTLLQTKYGTSTPTVANLFDLANQALGDCGNISKNMLSPINDAVSFINEKFDGCKWATFQGNQSGTNPIILGIDPLTTEDQPTQINLSVVPNPFITSTSIGFNISKTSRVILEVYNLMGSKIATLCDRNVEGGEALTYTYTANAAMGTQMLILVLRTDYGSKITRMILEH